MFCGNCGKQVEEGKAFCPFCGAAQGGQTEVLQAEENVALNQQPQAEVSEGIPNSEPVAVNQTVAEPIVTEETPKKKGKKALKISLFIAIPALLVALAIVLDVFSILGFITKTFGSDSAYFCYAEQKALMEESDPVFDLYEDILDFYDEPEYASDTEIKLNIGNSAETLIKSFAGDAIDLSSFKDYKFKYESNFKDGKFELVSALTSEKDSKKFKFVVDSVSNKAYLSAPESKTNDVYFELPEELKKVIPGATKIDYSEYLPSKNELRLLIKKYSDIVFDNIDDVAKIGNSVTVGEITQSCSVLQLDIDEKLLANCLLAIIEECREDDDVKDILTDLQALANQLDANSQVDLYNELLKALNDGQAQIQSTLQSLAGSDGEKFASIVTYVANNGEIIGREFYAYENDQKELLSSSLVAEDGDKFAILSKSGNDQIVFQAQGTGDYGKNFSFNGKLILENKEFVNIEVKDCVIDDKDISGRILLKLGKDLTSVIPSEAQTIVSLINPTFELKLDCSEDESNISINVLKDTELLVGLDIVSTKKDAQDVVFNPNNAVDGSKSENISDWFEKVVGLDLSDIMNFGSSQDAYSDEDYYSDYSDYEDYEDYEDEIDYSDVLEQYSDKVDYSDLF